MFNLFRILADVVHCVSIYLFIGQIFALQSVSGLSYKTQLIYMVVYATRYLDLFKDPFRSFYNTLFKLVYLGTSAWILYLMKTQFRKTLNPQIDTLKTRYLYGGAAVMALLFHLKFTFTELLWSYSIWLESVAILPQLFMVQRTGKAEALTPHYIFALGVYRALYIINWIYKWAVGTPVDWISVTGGIIQTALYSDFFYVYYTKVIQGQSFTLPT